jgi:hypothetical protein
MEMPLPTLLLMRLMRRAPVLMGSTRQAQEQRMTQQRMQQAQSWSRPQ